MHEECEGQRQGNLGLGKPCAKNFFPCANDVSALLLWLPAKDTGIAIKQTSLRGLDMMEQSSPAEKLRLSS